MQIAIKKNPSFLPSKTAYFYCSKSLILSLVMSVSLPVQAAVITWNGLNSQWQDSGNWIGGVIPGINPPYLDTAVFASGGANVSNNVVDITLEAINFTQDAFSIGNSGGAIMTLTGLGIVNTSGVAQTINNLFSTLTFTGSADAGSNVTIQTSGAGGSLNFEGTTTAGNASIVIGGGGLVNISNLTASGISIGSLSGFGSVNLGSKQLTVGSLNTVDFLFSTVFGVGGQLIKVGSAVLTMSGNNTYSGGTTINAGTISISTDNNLGTGALTMDGGTLQTTANISSNRLVTLNAGGGTFLTDAATTYTQNGQITGVGQLTKSGAGTLVLGSNLNNYSGGTLVLGGTLEANTDTLPGNVDISGGSFLNFQQNADGTFTGVISGAGSVIKNGNGTLTLNAIDTYSGQTTIDQGALQVTTDVIGFTDVTMGLNTGLIFNQNTSGTYSGVLDGAGSLIKFGTGTVTLSGVSSYLGGTFINEGILSISQDSNLGDAAGPLTFNGGILQTTNTLSNNRLISLGANGGTFLTDAATTLTENGQITGNGQLTKNGAGTLIFTNAGNYYTGGTVVNNGVLQAGAAGTFVDNTSYIINGGVLDLNNYNLIASNFSGNGGTVDLGTATLTLDQTTNSVLASDIIGTNGSNIIKNNSGSLTLTGNNSNFLGTMTVNNGDFIVNNTLGGEVIINPDARLKGNGTLGNTSVYGTIAPGNSIGTLTVNGNYVQEVGSIYEVEVNAAGQSDLINVTGTATIAGGEVQVISLSGNQYVDGTRYTILTAAGGVSGTYDNLSYSDTPFWNLALAYDLNNVYLDVARSAVSLVSLAATANELAVANAIESAGVGSGLYSSLISLTSVDSVRYALNSLSGEAHASLTSGFIIDSQHLKDAVLNRLNNSIRNLVEEPYRTFWVEGYGSWGQLDGNSDSATLKTQSSGVFFGLDADVSDSTRVGLITGFGYADYDVNARLSHIDSDDVYAGIYASQQFNKLAIRSGLAWTGHSLKSQRTISYPGVNDIQDSKYHAHTGQIFGEFGYSLLDSSHHHLEPIIQLNYVKVKNNSFAEQGNAMTALTGTNVTEDVFYTTLGIRGSSLIRQNDTWLYRFNGMLGWQYTGSQLAPSSVFAFNTGIPFIIGGSPIAENSLLINAGLELNPVQNRRFNL